MLAVLAAGAGCATSESGPPTAGAAGSSGGGATGAGGAGGTTAGSGGSSDNGGSGGSSGSSGAGGAGGAGGSIAGASGGGTTGGRGGAAGGASGSGGSAAGRGGSGSGGAVAGNGGSGGASAGTSGRGGTGGGASGGAGASGSAGAGGGSGASGAAGIGGGSLCTGGRFLLCEGFEGPVGNTPPSGWSRTGNAAIADDQAARGAHALKATPAADKGYGFFVYGNAEAFPAAHWGRLFYRVQTPPPDAFVHATMAGYNGDGPGIGASTFRVADTVKMAAPTSTHQFLFNVQITGDREFGKGSPYNWSFDGKWHCAEWFVDGANQAYQFYYDGTEVTQIRIQNGAGNYGSGSNETHLPMMFSDFRVGWTTYQTAPPGFTAWIDEVAIDANRIGCGN